MLKVDTRMNKNNVRKKAQKSFILHNQGQQKIHH